MVEIDSYSQKRLPENCLYSFGSPSTEVFVQQSARN